MFYPTEIIFSATDACNLHCEHCFVSRSPNRLAISDAKNFLQSCIDYIEQTPSELQKGNIQKIGFSGGEPFLYMDFMEELIKFTIEKDLMFDQIMTNGDWWKTEDDLTTTLQRLYDAGYDGKIGVSYDSFHGQSPERIKIFISAVQELFGEDSVVIQEVVSTSSTTTSSSSTTTGTSITTTRIGGIEPVEIKTYHLPQTFPSEDSRAWQARRWFKDDYCEGPGQVLFIHPNGNIAPCCGFANENKALFIGTIKDTFAGVLDKAANNQMIDIVYNKGLGKYRKQLKKQLKKQGKKIPGKTGDICSFCDFVCKLQ